MAADSVPPGAAPVAGPEPDTRHHESVILPEPIPDRIEPVNRLVWAVNKRLLTGIVKPTAKAYRFVVREPLRTGIRNFGRNISYPGRLINNLLQGKWAGARDESYRFGANTVLGAAGFFDVASKFEIPKWDADFGETLGHWGWDPKVFLMLPLFGPSNERDTVGLAADLAANPLTYLSPYRFHPTKPLTYLGPYSYASYAVMYNNLSDSVDQFVRFTQTEKDAYSQLAYAWKFMRETRAADYQFDGPQDPASLETLQSAFFSFKDPEFPNRGHTRSARIPTTGRELKFTFWFQPHPAPVVYIVPGLGSHRLAETALALAELLYNNGFSPVSVSSPFNYEFMENASTSALPAHTPIDACDLHLALTQVHRQLEDSFPGRVTAKALLGYSMGGFYGLAIAAGACQGSFPLIAFDRCVALNTPVRLLYGTAKLDEFFRAPLAWPPGERASRMENAFLKVMGLTQGSVTLATTLPFSGIESQFLVGVAFRLILRDAIFSSQERNNHGVLLHPINRLRREPVYREILQYSFQDYFEKFVVPYYNSRAPDLNVAEFLEHGGDLRNYTAGLQANPNIRVVGNENDFLLAEADLQWLRSVFAPNRLTLFESGGHLGNLEYPDLQKALLNALHGLDNGVAPLPDSDPTQSGTNAY